MERRCIYCNADNDLSESDIIPDALTNARITNKNVCRMEHNNDFSDMFEFKVITALAFITNILDVKSSKGKGYAQYHATVNIDGIDYAARIASETELFSGRILKSVDGKHIMSSIEKAKTIAKDQSKVTEVDVNSLILEKKVNIDTSIYFDRSMLRLASKIAFEWYCARNYVSGYHDDFKKIVSFITDGTDEKIVSIVQNSEIYDLCAHQLNLGSHCLLAFQGDQNEINVIVYLFGIVMYRVVVCDHTPDFCTNNCLYQELCTDTSRKEVFRKSVGELNNQFLEYFSNTGNFTSVKSGKMTAMIAKDIPQIDIVQSIHISNLIKYFSHSYDETLTPNEQINSILLNNIRAITQASLLHKKSLKRFVKEHCKLATEPIQLNPKTINKKDIFMMYVLFVIGKSTLERLDDQTLQTLIKEALSIRVDGEIRVNDELEESLKNEIIGTTNYTLYIQRGAILVNEWN